MTTEDHRPGHVPFDAGNRDDNGIAGCAGNQPRGVDARDRRVRLRRAAPCPKAQYLFIGRVVDTKTYQDYTKARLDEINKVAFSDLPLEVAMKEVKGNGKRVIAVFEDPPTAVTASVSAARWKT